MAVFQQPSKGGKCLASHVVQHLFLDKFILQIFDRVVLQSGYIFTTAPDKNGSNNFSDVLLLRKKGKGQFLNASSFPQKDDASADALFRCVKRSKKNGKRPEDDARDLEAGHHCDEGRLNDANREMKGGLRCS